MQEWKVLAKRGESAAILRCPGGQIHLHYGNITLRFSAEEFGVLAAMVVEARANQDETPQFTWLIAPSIDVGAVGFSND